MEWTICVAGIGREKKIVFVSDENGGDPKPYGFIQVKKYVCFRDSCHKLFVDLLDALKR